MPSACLPSASTSCSSPLGAWRRAQGQRQCRGSSSRRMACSRARPEWGVLCAQQSLHEEGDHGAGGPYCVYVGPIDDADKADLEDLYVQAKDEYYSGRPVLMDEVYDRVEKRLRWFKSNLVNKYPRCSLKKYAVYSDAVWDEAQIVTLCGVWASIALLGLTVAMAPPLLFFSSLAASPQLAHQDSALDLMISHLSSTLAVDGCLLTSACAFLGLSTAVAAGRCFRDVWNGGVAALKGSCPACGDEVYAFIRLGASSSLKHICECHVCQHPLAFQATVEKSDGSKPWGFGRIYSLIRAQDLSPEKKGPLKIALFFAV